MPDPRPIRRPQTWQDLANEYAALSAACYDAIRNQNIDLEALRADMVVGFAMLEKRLNYKTHTSGAPRAYTIPVTDTGSVNLDAVQDRLDALEEEKRVEKARADAIARHVAHEKEAGEARLRKYTAIFSILIALGTILGFLSSHIH